MFLFFLLSCLFPFLVAAAPQPQIPSLKSFAEAPGTGFRLDSSTKILVDSNFQDSGAPSLLSFAKTFRADLASLTGFTSLPDVATGDNPSPGTIFLSLGTASEHKLFNGQKTGEGYDFDITNDVYTIRGAEAIGTWWGTRTLLQQVALNTAPEGPKDSITIPAGSGSDTPGWEIRGFMLDAGRHWFEPSFIADLCIYGSFFKLQTLHIHASDNLWNQKFLSGNWRELPAFFRFRPSPGSPIAGLVPDAQRRETWTKEEFQSLQSTCSDHGVTLVPEVDTPGHSLVISKWKEQLMIPGQPDHLDLEHPETIPTIKAIWDETLPWFTSPEVSIGADEYDPDLANVYIAFVNEMSSYIKEKSGKSIRVWGTNEPSNTVSISTAVTIQHWNFPGDSVPVKLMEKGYKIINSEQQFLYLDGKTSDNGQFPVELQENRIWSGAPGGKGWAPNIFSRSDPSNNTSIDNPLLRGSIMALWNDWGNNATTPLEIYYQLAKSLAMFSEKVWAGSDARDTGLTLEQFNQVYARLNTAAPGQNLNRAVSLSSGSLAVEHNGQLTQPMETSFDSIGPPYTLSFSIKPRYPSAIAVRGYMGVPILVPSPPEEASSLIFSGRDSRLYAKNLAFQDSTTKILYRLPFDPPTDSVTNVEIHATRESTYALINGSQERLYYKTNLDIWGFYMKEANMSFAAPSKWVGSSRFEGELSDVKLIVGVV